MTGRHAGCCNVIQTFISQMKNKRPTRCHLLFYFTSYVLNIFRTLIYPSPGACDYSVELPHWSYCSWFDVCWSFGVVGLEWYPCCRLKHKSCASACNTDTTTTQPHWISNTQRTKNITTDVVIQQHSRKLLVMDILMSETCWAHKKWNKIASDIELVFYYATITMMHGPINIRFTSKVKKKCNKTICKIYDRGNQNYIRVSLHLTIRLPVQ